jgi:hypothetical protein
MSHFTTFQVVSMNDDDTIRRRLFKSTSYARCLGFLEQHLPDRPNLDLVGLTVGGTWVHVDWTLMPAPGAPAVQGRSSAPDRRRNRGATTA